MNSPNHVVSMNTIDYNQVNDVVDNELKLDISSCLFNIPVIDPLPVVNIRLRGGKNTRHTLNSVLTCLWENRDTKIMIKRKNINLYKANLIYNKVK